ncbi:hypothetical protein Tco_1137725 [Tanacetum coccineum]
MARLQDDVEILYLVDDLKKFKITFLSSQSLKSKITTTYHKLKIENTLDEYMILSGADNRPPMLDKDLYDSWKSRMELYKKNKEHKRMILESAEHSPFIWPTIEENGVTRTKKYVELSAAKKIQADCDMKATNIILQGLPADIYSLVNQHIVAKDLWERVQLLMQEYKVEVPSELPKLSLVNASLKKLNFHLAQFDYVVKKRTTPDARTEELQNEIMEVHTNFDQMEAFVQQSSVDKQCLEIAKKYLLLENDRPLQQIMSQDVLLTMMNSMSLIGESVNMERKRNEFCDKCFNLDAEFSKSQHAYNDLLKSCLQLEKHCISLELSIQLNQEIFQKDESCDYQNALEIPEYFKNNDLKAQLQDKDTTICKLKEIIKSMRENSKEENVNYDYFEIETKNVELENSVTKFLSENERLCKEINHVKQVFKYQFDSIKQTHVRTKEQSDSLIDKMNLKCTENEDLKAQIQDKVFMITSSKNYLRKVKGKEIVDIAAQIPSVNTIVPGMFKLDIEPLAPRLLQNREAHIEYLKYTLEQADILWGITTVR